MQTEVPKVSVIMCSGGYKPNNLRNTLYAWSKSSYPIELTLVNTNNGNPSVENIAKDFPFIHKVTEPPADDPSVFWARTTRAWTREAKQCNGDYVIFAMEDEIIGNWDIVKSFITNPCQYSLSVRTYFLSPSETDGLDNIDWKSDPKELEKYPDFWNHTTVEGADNHPNTYRKVADASLHSHIIGAPREHWEYMNWFRTELYGYFWFDMDLHRRECTVKRDVSTLPEPNCCYHQWHKLLQIPAADREYEGFIYENEQQARLLEPSRRTIGGEYKLPDAL